MMIEIFDRKEPLKRSAYLENAFNIREEETLNGIGYLEFKLPASDPKNGYCKPLQYVRCGAHLYRIIAPGKQDGETAVCSYRCEHVIATLLDKLIFGHTVIGNLGVYTSDVIRYILDQQINKHWTLGDCAFARQFEYGWEDENLLAMLFSVPNRFTEPYRFSFDTSSYPWRISLYKIDPTGTADFYIHAGRNLLTSNSEGSNERICTRLYCRGYGEGVNQLTIAKVNNGVSYLQSPPEIVAKYGIIERNFIDRRFEDAEHLKERGQVLLNGLQEPYLERTISVADLEPISDISYNRARIGCTVLIDDGEERIKTYITQIVRKHDVPGDMQITIANQPQDIASSIADLADRQRIEQVYSQGATQLYAQSVQANASSTKEATLRFYLPEEMLIINKVQVKIKLESFRAFSQATKGGGGISATTEAGGYTSKSTSSGGGDVQTSSSVVLDVSNIISEGNSGPGYAKHNHGIPDGVRLMTADGQSYGFVPSGAHEHEGHSHQVAYPDHIHRFTVPDHEHAFKILDHTHEVTPGIFYFGNPQSASIYINGVYKGSMNTDHDTDITGWMLDQNGRIPRGSWIELSVRPDDLAYITIDLYVQGFVQSRGGGKY